jgi:hypothetical protein
MSMFTKLAAAAALLFALIIGVPTAAHAETADHQCEEGETPNGNTDPQAPYCNPGTPGLPPCDSNSGTMTGTCGQPSDECSENGGATDANGGTNGGGGGAGGECAEQDTPRGEACDEQNGGAANGGTDDTTVCDEAEVMPNEAEQGGGPTGGPATVEGTSTEAAPASAEVSPAAAAAPSGTLPFTGGDVIGMTVIGAGAVALGSILVLRSKKSAKTAA